MAVPVWNLCQVQPCHQSPPSCAAVMWLSAWTSTFVELTFVFKWLDLHIYILFQFGLNTAAVMMDTLSQRKFCHWQVSDQSECWVSKPAASFMYRRYHHLADDCVESSVRPNPLQILATLAALNWLKTWLWLKIWHFFTVFILALQHPGNVWLDTPTVCSVCPTCNLFDCPQPPTVFQGSLQLCCWLLIFFPFTPGAFGRIAKTYYCNLIVVLY